MRTKIIIRTKARMIIRTRTIIYCRVKLLERKRKRRTRSRGQKDYETARTREQLLYQLIITRIRNRCDEKREYCPIRKIY